jgi:hypothetical protein
MFPQNRHLLLQHIGIQAHVCPAMSVYHAFKHPDAAVKHQGLRGVKEGAKACQSTMDRAHQLPFVHCAFGCASRAGAGKLRR